MKPNQRSAAVNMYEGTDPMMMVIMSGGGNMAQLLPLIIQSSCTNGFDGNSPMPQAMRLMTMQEFNSCAVKI
jgi:hypothetical protein